jgi:hypothetical protein
MPYHTEKWNLTKGKEANEGVIRTRKSEGPSVQENSSELKGAEKSRGVEK